MRPQAYPAARCGTRPCCRAARSLLAACGGGAERQALGRRRASATPWRVRPGQRASTTTRRVCDRPAGQARHRRRRAAPACPARARCKPALQGVRVTQARGPPGHDQGQPRERRRSTPPRPTSRRPTTRSRWCRGRRAGRSARWARTPSGRRRALACHGARRADRGRAPPPGPELSARGRRGAQRRLEVGLRDRADARRGRAGVAVARDAGATASSSPTAVSSAPGSRRRSPPAWPSTSPRAGGLVEGGDVVAEARALDHRAVERQPEVGEQVAAHRVERGAGSSVTADGTAATMSKPSSVLPARSRPVAHLGHDDVADVVRVAQPEHHAVGDLAGQRAASPATARRRRSAGRGTGRCR